MFAIKKTTQEAFKTAGFVISQLPQDNIIKAGTIAANYVAAQISSFSNNCAFDHITDSKVEFLGDVVTAHSTFLDHQS